MHLLSLLVERHLRAEGRDQTVRVDEFALPRGSTPVSVSDPHRLHVAAVELA